MPLDNEDQVQEQLEQLPNITRYQYAQAGEFLKSRFDPIAVQYQQAITSNQSPQQLLLLETQLTWLTYIIGAQIGGHMTMASTGREGHEKTDALLGQGIFRLMQLVDRRLVQTNGSGKCDPKLELSLMYFFQEFRRCYIGEHHGMPTEQEMEEYKKKKDNQNKLSSDSDDDDDVMGSSGGTNTKANAGNKNKPLTTAQRKRAMYLRMFELMSLGDHKVVDNI